MTALARLIARLETWTGLDLDRGSAHASLARYLRARVEGHDPETLARFVDGLVTPHHPEVVRLLDAITVCHSSFYRDAEQLAAISYALRQDTSRPAAIWVAACATGEDPYTLALVAESIGRRVSILATDINARALAHAERGEYGAWSVRDLPPSMAIPRRPDGLYEVPQRLRDVVRFARHNLMDPAPAPTGAAAGGWDVIVCRNVFMYLARDRVESVLRRLAASLRPGGYLFIGANDILDRAPPLLRFVRIDQRHALWRPPHDDAAPEGVPEVVIEQGTARLAPMIAPRSLPSLGRTPTRPGATPLAVPIVPLPSSSSLPSPPLPSTSPPLPSLPSSPSSPPLPSRTSTAPLPPLHAYPRAATLPGVPPPPPALAPLPPTPPPPEAAAAGPQPAAPAVVASLAEAHALLERGETPASLAILLAVLDTDPLCIEARLLAGIAYHLENDAHQAAAALRGALVLAPELWPAEMYLGFALARLGDDAGSGRALRRGGALAASTDRLPLSPPVAAWLESWRVDAIAMAARTSKRFDAV